MNRLLGLVLLAMINPASFSAEPDGSLAIDYRITNVDIVAIDGVPAVVISCVGDVDGYGHVRGTATLRGVTSDADGGPAVWRAMAIGETGIATDVAPGSWQRTGANTFRVRNISNVSDGTALMGDSIVDLEAGTMKGSAAILE